MKNKAMLASAAAIVMLSAFLFAPVRSVTASVVYQGMSILSSDIEATTIGLTNPSTAKFTSAGVGNLVAGGTGTGQVPWNPQGYTGGTFFGFSQNGGATNESDFINYSSTGDGGFYWWTPPSGGLTAPIMTLTPAGVLTTAEVDSAFHGNLIGNVAGSIVGSQGTLGNLIVACNGCGGTTWTNLGFTAGSWLTQGQEGFGNQETDFINLHPPATGAGFAWWSPTGTGIGSPLMTLSAIGVLTVTQVNGNAATATTASSANTANSATTAGTTTGNAATATQLLTTPAQCPAGSQATGITANGTANCTATKTLWASTTSVCTTPSGGGSCNTTTLTWPGSGFSNVNYLAVCQGYNMSGSGAIVNISVTSQTLTQVGLTLTEGTASQANPATFSSVACVGNGT